MGGVVTGAMAAKCVVKQGVRLSKVVGYSGYNKVINYIYTKTCVFIEPRYHIAIPPLNVIV